MKKTAIILGASGLTGGYILDKLINDQRYDTIKLFARTKLKEQPDKVRQFIGDLLELEQFEKDFTADEVYCCIGTTKSKTPDRALYKKIDYGIPVEAAKLAKANGIETFIVMSSMGADKTSRTFYTKTKGEMEGDVRHQNILNTFILRPSLIGGNRDEKRTLEKIGLTLFKAIQPLLIGSLKKYRIIHAETIANAMIYLANTTAKNDVIITSNQIENLGTNSKNEDEIMELLEKLNWRYAAKAMNGETVAEDKIDRILEAARLAPTSSGLQPFEIIVIKNQELKEKIRPVAWNQSVVTECSHLLVFAAWDHYTADRINYMFDLTNKVRGFKNEGWENYRQMLLDSYPKQDKEVNFNHAAKQAYIALGMAMVAAAYEKVDCTPMEGFSADKVDEILGLRDKGLRSCVLLPVGYRKEDNDWLVNLVKVRKPITDLVTVID